MLAKRILLPDCFEGHFTIDEVGKFGAAEVAADSLGVVLLPRLTHAVPTRRAEFVAGRAAALGALRAAGFKGGAELNTRHSRAPVWPSGFVGSIAHSHGLAWAVAAPCTRFRALGIDLERILSDAEATEVAPAVMGSDEFQGAADSGLSLGAFVTLVFSAKESLYKCLNPLLGVEFGFHDLRAAPLKSHADCVALELLTPLGGEFVKGQAFDVQFTIDADLVRTAIALKAPKENAVSSRSKGEAHAN
ncbi:MAG: 4'-phosphopantetheinyl transferase superfamily protein [Burkholderiaceae bacterium]|jgi:enterobactin synthetase component D